MESQGNPKPSLAGLIGLFQLDTSTDVSAPTKTALHESTQESVFDSDYRTVVDPSLYQDGGIYRSIVKLQMRYERQTGSDQGWYMGTGWLITPDIMVTAGHNVYNWSGGDDEHGLGKAVTIKCHIGYHGKESVGTDANVQSRLAKRCVTSAEWLEGKDNRHRDFAFIQVDRPFTGNLRLFNYEPTPMAAEEMIGVVGYPGDRSITDSAGKEERGAMMYKEFAPTQYDRKTTKLGMLSYRISTFGGQSGAPVIREGKQVGIATHVYGFGDKNQASPIVDYDNFANAFTKNYPHVGTVDGINLHKPVTAIGQESTLDTATGEESFLDILKQVGGVVSKVGQAVVPTIASTFLGPMGGPVSGIAGAALGVLGRVCAESTQDGPESAPEQQLSAAAKVIEEGEAQRGVLAEATLQGVEKLHEVHGPHHPVLSKIHHDMAQTYSAIAPCVKQLAPHFKHELVRSAALIGCGTDFMAKSHAHITVSHKRKPIHDSTTQQAESAYGGGNAFAEGIMAPTKPLQGEEAFFETVGTYFSKGLQAAKPVLRASAVAGLQEIAKRLAASNTAESTVDATSDDGHETAAAELVLHRAAMAESALQAVHKLSAQELASLEISGIDGNEANQESFFDFVKTAAQKIGGVVSKAAPVVIKTVLPAVLKAVAGGGQESTRDGSLNGAQGSRLLQPQAEETLRPRPSRINLFDQKAFGSNQLGQMAVGALLPKDGTLTEQDLLESRRNTLHTTETNQDLPVYQIYD
ncbi:hypothetical protein N0V82_000631 [Gnomoniopsis sp. IMI 355080]|nr:hypothetical protein N0V82_000631 [Gnomoniopsis sp. IMI 355080]